MAFYLVRHPRPAIATGICYGQSDLDVTDDFAMEFTDVHQQLNHLHKAIIYSSPLLRCRKLADALYQTGHYRALIYDNRLMELNFGAWEMQAWDAIPRAELDVWAEHYLSQAPPLGESVHSLQLRVDAFLAELPVQSEQAVIIVSHAGVIRYLLSLINNITMTEALSLNIPYASIQKLSFSDKTIAI